jgi:hypothetical protein
MWLNLGTNLGTVRIIFIFNAERLIRSCGGQGSNENLSQARLRNAPADCWCELSSQVNAGGSGESVTAVTGLGPRWHQPANALTTPVENLA